MERPSQIPAMWKPYAEAARERGSRLTGAALGPGRSSGRLDDLVRRLHRELDRMMQQAFASLPGEGLACAPGCDLCCRTLAVTVVPIEVFALVRRLRGSHAHDLVLQARLAAFAPGAAPSPAEEPLGEGRTGAQTSPRRALAPCPLLAGGVCLVYSSRPMACRGCVSPDSALCAAACYDDQLMPSSIAHQLGAAAMARGVVDALETLGLAGRPIELRSGLASALCDDAAEKRWLRGDDVFAGLP